MLRPLNASKKSFFPCVECKNVNAKHRVTIEKHQWKGTCIWPLDSVRFDTNKVVSNHLRPPPFTRGRKEQGLTLFDRAMSFSLPFHGTEKTRVHIQFISFSLKYRRLPIFMANSPHFSHLLRSEGHLYAPVVYLESAFGVYSILLYQHPQTLDLGSLTVFSGLIVRLVPFAILFGLKSDASLFSPHNSGFRGKMGTSFGCDQGTRADPLVFCHFLPWIPRSKFVSQKPTHFSIHLPSEAVRDPTIPNF